MLVIRPVHRDDLDALCELASLAQFGLTTLPKDRKLLEKRVRHAVDSFEKGPPEKPGNQLYLFVLYDSDGGGVVGTCGIEAKVGGYEPFYAYRIETTVHESKALGVRKEVSALHLVEQHSGPTEIGSLFLHPERRSGGTGRLLSLSRFLFIAEFPSAFEKQVIAEMRGVIDERGRSAFWDAVGRHFFDIEFAKADALSIADKAFIGELMPRHPIYIPLLPEEARGVIGRVHPKTEPALAMLMSEGFERTDMIDIFEAGPIVRAERDSIRAVRESRVMQVGGIEEGMDDGAGGYVVSNRRWDVRAVRGEVREEEGRVTISARAAAALGVVAGESVRFAALKAGGGMAAKS